MTFKYNKNLTPYLGWFGYLIFWITQYNIEIQDTVKTIEYTLFQMGYHFIAVYLNNQILIPKYLYHQKYLNYLVCYFSLIVTIGSLNLISDSYFFDDVLAKLYDTNTVKDGLTVSCLLVIFVTSIPAWYKVNSDKLKSDNDAKQLLNDKIEEELKFLKAQINPHFLFNSLNTVFNLIDIDKEAAQKTLVQFSELLRFQLYEVGNDLISIENEIEYIKSYANIEKIRKGDSIDISIKEDVPYKISIPPLILLTFVENAFKHVSNLEKGNYILIEIKTSENELDFSIKNSIDHYQKIVVDKTNSGIGLSNIRRRLNLLFPEKHSLEIQHNDRSYTAHLKLFTNG